MEIEAYLLLKWIGRVSGGDRGRGRNTGCGSGCHGVVGLGFLISPAVIAEMEKNKTVNERERFYLAALFFYYVKSVYGL